MKTPIAMAAVLVLAACSSADEPVEAEPMEETVADDIVLTGDEPGFEAVAPGEYEVVQEDGTTDMLTIHPGMTWSMVFANGDAAGGTIYMQGGETCFVTEGEEGADCFTAGEVDEDGSMVNTSSEGTVMTVRPVGEATAE